MKLDRKWPTSSELHGSPMGIRSNIPRIEPMQYHCINHIAKSAPTNSQCLLQVGIRIAQRVLWPADAHDLESATISDSGNRPCAAGRPM